MCGRFTNKLTWDDIVRLYRLTLNAPPHNLRPRYNVCEPTMKLTIIMVILVALSGMGVALAQETQMAQKPFNAVSNFLGRFGRSKNPTIAARQDYEHAARAYRRCIARKLMGACEPQRYRMDSAFALMRTLNHPPD